MPIRKTYDRNFFKKWSPSMAYVLGFLYADGNIVTSKRGGRYVSLYSADRDLVYEIRSALGSDHHIGKRTSPTGFHYRIQIGSKEMFNDLIRLGMTTDKALRMIFPNVPSKYFGDFVRGYFDGDGNVWTGNIHKERKRTTPVIFAAFTSGSVGFLKILTEHLRRRGVKGGNIFRPKDGVYGRLTLSTLDALKLYGIMYNVPHKLYLERKKRVFEQFIKERTKLRA